MPPLMRQPAYFLSYARADRGPVFGDIKRFRDDLSTVVAQRLGPEFDPGFLDTANIVLRDRSRSRIGVAAAVVLTAVLSVLASAVVILNATGR